VNNSYLGSKPYLPDFLDLASVTVGGIEHEDFLVSLVNLHDEGGRLALAVSSPNRRHDVGPGVLDGTETMVEVLELARHMIEAAMADDVAYRFRFKGCPIFARAEVAS
jgi:hypothetical protein